MRLLRYAPSDSSTYLKYASGVLGRKPCTHIRLDLLATNPCEKCGLMILIRGPRGLFAESIDLLL
jgi:hypothetical protein